MSSASKLDLPTANIGDDVVTGKHPYVTEQIGLKLKSFGTRQLSAMALWALAVSNYDTAPKP